jgi:hypothetical protein
MAMVASIAGEGCGADVLVEELDPVQTEIEQMPHVGLGDLLGLCRRYATHVAGPLQVQATHAGEGKTQQRSVCTVLTLAGTASRLIGGHLVEAPFRVEVLDEEKWQARLQRAE